MEFAIRVIAILSSCFSEDGFVIESKLAWIAFKLSREHFMHLLWIKSRSNPCWFDSSIGIGSTKMRVQVRLESTLTDVIGKNHNQNTYSDRQMKRPIDFVRKRL